MKIKFFIIVFLIINTMNAQDIYTTNDNGKVFLNNQKISPSKVKELMANNSQALDLYKRGRLKKTLGNILLYGGIGFVAVKHYTMVKTDNSPYHKDVKTDNSMYFVGAGMIIAAIPIKIGFSERIKDAVDSLNESNKYKTKIESSILINNNGFGIQLRF